MPQIDTRLIQTAVMGGKDGDRPVILPEEAHNLDEFRRQYGQTNFWCGTLLGGCGEKLMTKRYETKVCHFAHHPDRYGTSAECHRTSEGADGADHLFIKQHVKDWLTGQGHAAEASLRTLGTGPGDAVDFWLRATEQHLRFELRPEDYRSWRKAAESLGAREGHVEWVFGPENTITHDMVARQGYALRVRCETEGTDRRVLIGTVTADRPVVWDPLATCRMTRVGIATPTLEELRAAGKMRIGGMRHASLPTSLPVAGPQLVFAIDSGATAPTGSPFDESGRHLYMGYLKPTAKRIIRTMLSLPADVPPPADDHVYQLSGAVRILITEPVGAAQAYWAVRADAVTRLNGIAAERTGLWRPSVALEASVSLPAPRNKAARKEKNAKALATVMEPLPQPVHAPQARALREKLQGIARKRDTTTWKQLSEEFDIRLRQLSDHTLRDLLVEVDQAAHGDSLPLSVLVLARGGRKKLPYLGAILRSLGIDAPESGAALQQWSTETISRIHEAYGASGSVKPDEAPQRTSSGPANEPMAVTLGTAYRQLGLLRGKASEANQVAARATGLRAERLSAVVAETEAHIRLFAEVRGNDKALRHWSEAGKQLQERLANLIGHSPVSPQATTSRPAAATPLPPVTTEKELFSHAPQSGKAPAESTTTMAEPNARNSSHAEALAEFTRLTAEIETARKGDDLKTVQIVYNRANVLYSRRISAEEKTRFASFMRDIRVWCAAHRSRPEAGAALQRIRQLLTRLERNRGKVPTSEIQLVLDAVREIRNSADTPLPPDEEERLARWDALVRQRTAEEQETLPPAAVPDQARDELRAASGSNVPLAPTRPGRLSRTAVERLAASAREILMDTARTGGAVLTWGDLRARLKEPLPHLHPDDQGELLVAVDRNTPQDEPLLTTLMASADISQHWLYPHVRFSLHRPRIPEEELAAHWAREILKLRQIWRHR
ncbi:hypothetical protein [Streptomyces sp. NBC_00342]|uniref:hypothetical protein n=1 Tax=Streptomyces sp. NBC_00342 TaxID=2975718 RepID=UPI002E2ABC40|nr:hypothetical protein [Streptomyces sp. NBC_00342]